VSSMSLHQSKQKKKHKKKKKKKEDRSLSQTIPVRVFFLKDSSSFGHEPKIYEFVKQNGKECKGEADDELSYICEYVTKGFERANSEISYKSMRSSLKKRFEGTRSWYARKLPKVASRVLREKDAEQFVDKSKLTSIPLIYMTNIKNYNRQDLSIVLEKVKQLDERQKSILTQSWAKFKETESTYNMLMTIVPVSGIAAATLYHHYSHGGKTPDVLGMLENFSVASDRQQKKNNEQFDMVLKRRRRRLQEQREAREGLLATMDFLGHRTSSKGNPTLGRSPAVQVRRKPTRVETQAVKPQGHPRSDRSQNVPVTVDAGSTSTATHHRPPPPPDVPKAAPRPVHVSRRPFTPTEVIGVDSTGGSKPTGIAHPERPIKMSTQDSFRPMKQPTLHQNPPQFFEPLPPETLRDIAPKLETPVKSVETPNGREYPTGMDVNRDDVDLSGISLS
jgi:hypothetical protein